MKVDWCVASHLLHLDQKATREQTSNTTAVGQQRLLYVLRLCDKNDPSADIQTVVMT